MTATISHAWFNRSHVREDNACKSPRPHPIFLAGQHVRQAHYSGSPPAATATATEALQTGGGAAAGSILKRKRADSIDPPSSPPPAASSNLKYSKLDAHAPSLLLLSSSRHFPVVRPSFNSPVTPSPHHHVDAPIKLDDPLPSTTESPPLMRPTTDKILSSLEQQQHALPTPNTPTFHEMPAATSPSLHSQGQTSMATTCDAMDVDMSAVNDAHLAAVEAKARNSVHDNISIFLSTQILFKQKELRLIESEQAKCQIALEQLRRCRVIPYPGQPSSSASSENIITGTGPALEPRAGLPRPPHAAPFGVTDGPYTRHYARWLIQDPAFDAVPARTPRTVLPTHHNTAGPTPAARRPKPTEDPVAPRKRSTNAGFDQFSAPASNFKDGQSRLIVRNDQGDYVKIMCKICHKGNSSNLQGFVNHTRIAHSISYVSHAEAVKDCSQPLTDMERDVANDMITKRPTQTPHDDHQQVRRRHVSTPSVTVTPAFVPVSQAATTSLLLDGPSRQSMSGQKLHAYSMSQPRVNGSIEQVPRKKPFPLTSKQGPSTSFVASSATPALSRKLQKLGYQDNLQARVTAAQTHIDFNAIQPIESDSDDVEDAAPVASKHTGVRLGACMVKGEAPASSRLPGRMLNVATPTDSPMQSNSPVSSEAHTIPDSFMTDATSILPSEDSSFISAHHGAAIDSQVSPRTADDPGMVTDDDEDDDDFQSYGAEDAMSRDGDNQSVDVMVQDDHSLGDHSEFHIDPEDSCASQPHNQSYFTSFLGTPQTGEKKRRGRPRKNV